MLKALHYQRYPTAIFMRKSKGQKKAKTNSQLRVQITKIAAKLMYEEGVSQYYDAKRIAAKRMFTQGGGKKFWIKDLPSNGEISEALASIADLHEGESRVAQLFAMRVVALDIMESLSPFQSRLIGSVSTGRVRAGSDIDLHVFTEDIKSLECHLKEMGWLYETNQVSILKQGKIEEFTHIYIDGYFPIELSVYPSGELRVQGRSSTDGKIINRLKQSALQELIAEEHSEYWLRYLESGDVTGLPAENKDDEMLLGI